MADIDPTLRAATSWTPRSWFGEPWPRADFRAPVCEDDTLQVAAPVGLRCASCQEVIVATDRGTFLLTFEGPDPIHRECSFRQVMGGIGHHEDHALWCGERHDPDGGRTSRQSALEVWALHVGRIDGSS